MNTKSMLFVASIASAVALGIGGAVNAMSHSADDVRAFFEQAAADYVACDTSRIGAYSTDDHSGFYPDSGELQMEASDEARQAAIDFCEAGGKHEMSYEIRDVVMLKDAALVLASGHYKRTEPDGTVSVDDDFTLTDVLVKTDDGWKFRHSHVGAVMAPTEETASEE